MKSNIANESLSVKDSSDKLIDAMRAANDVPTISSNNSNENNINQNTSPSNFTSIKTENSSQNQNFNISITDSSLYSVKELISMNNLKYAQQLNTDAFNNSVINSSYSLSSEIIPSSIHSSEDMANASMASLAEAAKAKINSESIKLASTLSDASPIIKADPQASKKRLPVGFSKATNSYKSKAAKDLHMKAIKLSENEPGALYSYLFNSSKYGKEFFKDINPSEKEAGILENIRLLHVNKGIDHKYKSTVLALVAEYYSVRELVEAGFVFSRNQYDTARKKASKRDFSFTDYQRSLPESRRPLSDKELGIVFKYLINNSKITSATIKRGNIPKLEFEGNTMNLEESNYVPVYHLKKTKLDIYNLLKADYPDLKLCKSTFYRYIPKNFKVTQSLISSKLQKKKADMLNKKSVKAKPSNQTPNINFNDAINAANNNQMSNMQLHRGNVGNPHLAHLGPGQLAHAQMTHGHMNPNHLNNHLAASHLNANQLNNSMANINNISNLANIGNLNSLSNLNNLGNLNNINNINNINNAQNPNNSFY
ncbi:hypothetical protein BB561_000076 [Smittium simulii]|uniref:Uncharacterized protein n=1 Tax=Smittium simulii TaxID=133385 RepID=A0A2T9Z0P2_9FUNG|nr:hypothetical protein BB561_000076 [Smittium simulii]